MEEIEKIYRLYKDDIFRYLVSITGDPDLSEDLLSEVFIRAIKSIGRFKGRSTIKTWLLSIARYIWYDYLRKNKREVSIEDLISLYINENIERKTINKEVASRIIELLEKESKRNKDLVLMRVNGYSYHDIGRKHKISESSARVINYRLKNKIKDILEKEGLSDG